MNSRISDSPTRVVRYAHPQEYLLPCSDKIVLCVITVFIGEVWNILVSALK